MGLPPSSTRACNNALTLLGDSRRISSINDPGALAKTFAAVWDATVDEVLTAHPWNPALERAALAVSSDYVPSGSQYTQAFEKPADLLRWLPWRPSHEDYFIGEEEGDYILSNADAPITIRYIAKRYDLTRWSPGMLAVLDAKLAYKTARPITGQSSMMDRMDVIYKDAFSKAKQEDGAATGERARYAQFQSNWLDSRNRCSRGIIYR